MGISRQAISQWENEKSFPDIENIVFLSNLYNFDLNKFANYYRKKMYLLHLSLRA
ncbi:helix-turn-helix domain-containing protein [Liquorilactobacillus satsumensis]|uniref:helix-turn-helix domain-containing protein n=1 Tax=Liquorilactobacillus satsumensis TaxID=259059 RepID=UPI0039EBEEAD